MKIISVVEDNEVIKKILKHLGLWDSKPRPPPKPRPAAERNETLIDDSFSQLPASDNYLYVDPQYPEVYKAIESMLNQFYENWELCIADDGSTNNHVKGILKRYEKQDKRIIVKYLKYNKGIASASNEALFLATESS